MPTWGETYLREFNQLVEVYEPAGIEPVEIASGADDVALADRREEIEALRDRVRDLSTDELFSAEERETIEANDDLPDPAAVADDRRAELEQCLQQTSQALDEAESGLTGIEELETIDDQLEDV